LLFSFLYFGFLCSSVKVFWRLRTRLSIVHHEIVGNAPPRTTLEGKWRREIWL
jgi:hypothetical protein